MSRTFCLVGTVAWQRFTAIPSPYAVDFQTQPVLPTGDSPRGSCISLQLLEGVSPFLYQPSLWRGKKRGKSREHDPERTFSALKLAETNLASTLTYTVA